MRLAGPSPPCCPLPLQATSSPGAPPRHQPSSVFSTRPPTILRSAVIIGHGLEAWAQPAGAAEGQHKGGCWQQRKSAGSPAFQPLASSPQPSTRSHGTHLANASTMPFCCMSMTNWSLRKAHAEGFRITCHDQRSMRCAGVASSGSFGIKGKTRSWPCSTAFQPHSISAVPHRAQCGIGPLRPIAAAVAAAAAGWQQRVAAALQMPVGSSRVMSSCRAQERR